MNKHDIVALFKIEHARAVVALAGDDVPFLRRRHDDVRGLDFGLGQAHVAGQLADLQHGIETVRFNVTKGLISSSEKMHAHLRAKKHQALAKDSAVP